MVESALPVVIPEFVWLLVSYGLCFGLMNKLPWTLPVLKCAYCTGFHTGWMTWLWALGLPGSLRESVALAAWALASAATCYVLDQITQKD